MEDKKKAAIGGGAILLLALLAFGAAKVAKPAEVVAPEELLPLRPGREQQIYDLANQSVNLINQAKQAATARDWGKSLSLAQAASDAAHKAEALNEAPIPHKALPSLSLSALADSCVDGAKIQSRAAALTSPSGYASGGFEYAGDFGYGAGVF